MPAHSAGILLYRLVSGAPEVLLVHPGGPFWARKDEGAWSIPKGETAEGEAPVDAARREFAEETGSTLELSSLIELGEIRQRSGKRVSAWAAEGDLDPDGVHSNAFEMEWPPRSGRTQAFPEVDRAAWFDLAEARRRLIPAQAEFVDRLSDALEA
jgi:predicted NUDIX family NTP pyrophosphohydrolase